MNYEPAESVKIALNRDEASELVGFILDELADERQEIVLTFQKESEWENQNNG